MSSSGEGEVKTYLLLKCGFVVGNLFGRVNNLFLCNKSICVKYFWADKVIHLELRGSIRDVLDLLCLGGRDGITTGDAGESSLSSWVGGDGVIEGMAVERPGVIACPKR